MNFAFSLTTYDGILIFIILMNLVTFSIWGYDKLMAIRHRIRIRESTLLMLTFFGGAIGALIGMSVFHHKTQKMRFKLWVPVNFIVQAFTFGLLSIQLLSK